MPSNWLAREIGFPPRLESDDALAEIYDRHRPEPGHVHGFGWAEEATAVDHQHIDHDEIARLAFLAFDDEVEDVDCQRLEALLLKGDCQRRFYLQLVDLETQLRFRFRDEERLRDKLPFDRP